MQRKLITKNFIMNKTDKYCLLNVLVNVIVEKEDIKRM